MLNGGCQNVIGKLNSNDGLFDRHFKAIGEGFHLTLSYLRRKGQG